MIGKENNSRSRTTSQGKTEEKAAKRISADLIIVFTGNDAEKGIRVSEDKS